MGTLLVWCGLGAMGYVTGWTVHQQTAGKELVKAARRGSGPERTSPDASAQVRRTRANACIAAPADAGSILGVLSIPALGVTAPVEQGVSDSVLSVAVGHYPATVMPGAGGTSVLLAHDVSYFGRLNVLRAGDVMTFSQDCTVYRFQVYRQAVVDAGSALPGEPFASLALDTCWPTNALWFTPNRYVVMAREIGVSRIVSPAESAVLVSQAEGFAREPGVPAPVQLQAQGLTLQANEVPMGRMEISGSSSGAWAQSPGPLAVEAAALEAYFGGLHALAGNETSWWQGLAPGVAAPGALVGAGRPQALDPLNVAIDAQGDTPVSVTLSTAVSLPGGSEPGSYYETVTEAVNGSELTISSWTLRRA